MALAARWIRLGLAGPLALRAAYTGLAAAQPPGGAPIVLWAEAGSCVRCEIFDAEESQYVFVLIAPLRVVPGRRARWLAWALAPAIATYRHFGLRAYLDAGGVWLNGNRIARSAAAQLGSCAIAGAGFLPRFPDVPPLPERSAAPPAQFRAWLREGLGLALSEWAGHGETPAERELESVFRARIEAQHGWQFETSWPSTREQAAIAAARVRLAEPLCEALAR
jgi:hypothetical protein